jgi:hypothetical protein
MRGAYMKHTKRIYVSLLSFLFFISACSGCNSAKSPFNAMSTSTVNATSKASINNKEVKLQGLNQNEINKKLTNFSYTYATKINGVVVAVCEVEYVNNAFSMNYIESGESVKYIMVDNNKKTYYMLTMKSKNAMKLGYESYLKNEDNPFSYLLVASKNINENATFKKIGSDIIAGEKCTIYQYKNDFEDYSGDKIYISDIYNIIMKFIKASDAVGIEGNSYFVSAFTINSIKLSDVTVPSDYKITNFSNFTSIPSEG